MELGEGGIRTVIYSFRCGEIKGRGASHKDSRAGSNEWSLYWVYIIIGFTNNIKGGETEQGKGGGGRRGEIEREERDRKEGALVLTMQTVHRL